jgi:uncharacterized protein YndB with AHSA1/START domain
MDPQAPWTAWTDARAGGGTAVHVTRRLEAPREEVFRAWTEPKLFEQWFKPPGSGSLNAEMDVRSGGGYRITLRPTEGRPGTTYLVGTYLEVIRPERLAFTWGWEQAPSFEGLALNDLDSQVIVQFQELNGSTEISVTHERLDTEERRAFHRWGWESTLDQLASLTESR